MKELLEKEVLELEGIARDLRVEILRMIHRRQAGHPGGSLSAAEIVAVLYFKVLRIDPQRPDWPERTVLSSVKGMRPLSSMQLLPEKVISIRLTCKAGETWTAIYRDIPTD